MNSSFRSCVSIFLGVFVAIPSFVFAATLDITPQSISVRQGDSITLNVSVTSADQAMNAVSGTITFPNTLLAVISLSKANSIIPLWVQDPSFSNSDGTISFGGVVPNPGYTDSNGRIVSILFRALKKRTAAIAFSDASVLANDGKGTNILTSAHSATITLIEAPPVAPIQEESAKSVPVKAPVSSSSAESQPIVAAPATTGASTTAEVRATIEPSIPNGSLLLILALALLLLIATIAWYLFKVLRSSHVVVLHKLYGTHLAVHEQFQILKQTVTDEITHLEKIKASRTLSAEEERVLHHLKQAVDHAEIEVEKEIKRLGRERS